MHPVSDRWERALTGAHGIAVQVDLLLGDGSVVAEDIPIVGGSVTVDRGSEVRRSLRLEIADPADFPVLAGDPFSPYGHRLYVQRGIRYTDGTVEMVPLGYFVIRSISGDLHAGPLTISAPGLETVVRDRPFEQAVSTAQTATHAAFIADQLIQVDPSFVLVDQSSRGSELLATTTFDAGDSRWDAIRDVATAVGAEVFADENGSFVLRDIPEPTDEFVWTVAARENMVSAQAGMSADGVYNRVAVYGESAADNATPVYGVAEITDPLHPLYVGGPFGVRTTTYHSDLVTTTAGAIATAHALLLDASALNQTLTLRSVPNPALQAGDRIRVIFGSDRPSELHTVQQFTIPLTVDGDFTIETLGGSS